ncbi:protein kinase domain-containing protein [Nonomuraea endophytica]|uniref:non-specific serine/threonine protein kinase n=1 Tax=Nonomuraea endophytica TaxID=714136 RepID=A0A7W8A6P4_9ACTN|nr:PASTA domain-containing protein [Nonomuraea endophytica]MBB5080611.1 beta-lactam-binding protein with PASTA domain/predicted Ser/Thr protein kinase [Nonomuraea endophytica]
MPDTQPLKSGDPRQLGDYTLSGRLGEGGQGVVFLGMRGEERYAIKLLHGPVGDEQAAFLREVELAKHVARFCTAQVADAGFDDGRPYIVSEFVDGPSLYREVALTGPKSGGALERLAVGTATALAAIHRAGIVHRDFKPQNVLLGPDGPRVIDFGLARVLDAAATQSGRGVGTPAYMAPEQITAALVTGAADVFSWGATMCFAANASAPFGQDSVAPVLHRILTAPPELGWLDGYLRDLVAACLDKDARNRPSSRDLLYALLGDSDGVPAEVLRSPPPHLLRLAAAPMAEPETTGAAPDVYHLPAASGPATVSQDTQDVRAHQRASAANRAGLAVSCALLVSAAVLVTLLVPAFRSGDGPAPQAAAQPSGSAPALLLPQLTEPSPSRERQESKVRGGATEPAPPPPRVEPVGVGVPSLVGLDRSAAVKALRRAGLSAGTLNEVDSRQRIGRVLASRPAAGALLAKGTEVDLDVSAGLAVPELKGLSRKAAELALARTGLATGVVSRACSAQPGGRVLSSSPAAGGRVAGGSAVALVVAQHGAEVPAVVGKGRESAVAGLKAAGFAVEQRVQIVTEPGEVDTVLAQSVPAGRCAQPGRTVVITVGVEGQTGPDPGEPEPDPTPTPS